MLFPRGVRRARLLTLVVAGSAILAACVPATPAAPGKPATPAAPGRPATPAAPGYQTQYCLGGAPIRAIDYQLQHDGLRTVNTDFGAGDGGAPVALPDGRTLWLFGDTWTGYIQNGAMVAPYHLLRNAFVVQSGGCLTPVLGGSHGARSETIPAPAGEFYWPMGAYADGGRLYVFAQRFVPGGGLCGCVAQDIRIAKFTLPNLQFLGMGASPAPGMLPEFGSGVFTAGAFHYFVGRSSADGVHRNWHYLARQPVGIDPSPPSAVEYWNGGTSNTAADWTTSGMGTPCGSGGPCPMQFEMPGIATATNDGPNAALWVTPQPDGSFLASAKLRDVWADPITTWRSTTPYGPWTQPKFAASTPAPAGGFTFMGRVFQLPGAASVAQFSTNGPDNDRHTDSYKVIFSAPAP